MEDLVVVLGMVVLIEVVGFVVDDGYNASGGCCSRGYGGGVGGYGLWWWLWWW